MVLATALCDGPVSAKESAKAKVLNKWHGSWKHHTELKPAAWSLKAAELSGTSTGRWILGGRYQQISSFSGAHETREIHRYDANSNAYHKWSFDSEGGHSFWVGAWDEKTGTMTWKYMDFGSGIEGKIVNRFSGEGKYETMLVMKDNMGNLLLKFQSEHTRMNK